MILTALSAISAAFGFTHFTAPHASVPLMVSVRQDHAALLADALDERRETEVPAAHGGTVRLSHTPAAPGGHRVDMFDLSWVRPGRPGQDVSALRGWPLSLLSIEDFGGHRTLMDQALRRGDARHTPLTFRAWAGQTLVQIGTATLILPIRLSDLVQALQSPWDERHWTDGVRGIDLFDMGGEDGGVACWALRVGYEPQGWPEKKGELIVGLSDLQRAPKFADITVPL